MRLAALLLAIALSSTTADNEYAMRLLQTWVAAVDEHYAGREDEALARITKWNRNDLVMMQAYVEALAEAPVNRRDREIRRRQIAGIDLAAIKARTSDLQRRGDFDRFRKRAVILHTDAAILASAPEVATLPTPLDQKNRRFQAAPQARIDVLSNDGRVDQFVLANPHWEYAMSLLDALPASPARDPIVAQWYRAVGAYFANEHRYADAMTHFARAREVVPNDPQVLYGDACLQETLGAPRIQDYVRVTTLPNGLMITGILSPDTHWRRAESMLRKAIATEPRFVEANLRLGRTLIQLRRQEEGLVYLQTAIVESRDQVISYYAHLFSGDAAFSLGRIESARSAYEAAIAIFPHAQAARLGLGATLRTAGDQPAALAAMLPALTRERSDREGEDPWWDYYSGDARNVELLLGELRNPLRTKAP
jgi:tetratricopeptide (TPR) repeat protein